MAMVALSRDDISCALFKSAAIRCTSWLPLLSSIDTIGGDDDGDTDANDDDAEVDGMGAYNDWNNNDAALSYDVP